MNGETDSDRGAKRLKAGGSFWDSFRQQHQDAARKAWQRLLDTPISSAFGILVIAFAWLLPLMLHWVERNVSLIAEEMRATHGLHVFLKPELDEAHAEVLASTWRAEWPQLRARVIDRASGLAELSTLPGFEGIDAVIGDNPLPVVLSLDHDDANVLSRAQSALASRAEVDFLQSDTSLRARIASLQHFVAGAAWVAWALALAGALLLSLHLARLSVNADRDEIGVSHWLGASFAFIRRPMLYGGAIQGFIGASLAAILVLALVAATHRALVEFSKQFAGSIELLGPDPRVLIGVVALAVVLGWLGALVCTAIDLKNIASTSEPAG